MAINPAAKKLLTFFAAACVLSAIAKAIRPEDPLIVSMWLAPWCSLSDDNKAQMGPKYSTSEPPDYTGAPLIEYTHREICYQNVFSITSSLSSLALCFASIYVGFKIAKGKKL